jgi:hypothetical protein
MNLTDKREIDLARTLRDQMGAEALSRNGSPAMVASWQTLLGLPIGVFARAVPAIRDAVLALRGGP